MDDNDEFNDYFDGDGTLDALDTTELQALENQAIAASQQPRQLQQQKNQIYHGQTVTSVVPISRAWKGDRAATVGETEMQQRPNVQDWRCTKTGRSEVGAKNRAGVYGAGIGAPNQYRHQQRPGIGQGAQYQTTANLARIPYQSTNVDQPAHAQHQLYQGQATPAQTYENYQPPVAYPQQQRPIPGYQRHSTVAGGVGVVAGNNIGMGAGTVRRTGTLGQRAHTTPMPVTGKRALDAHIPIGSRITQSGGFYQHPQLPSQHKPLEGPRYPSQYPPDFSPHNPPADYLNRPYDHEPTPNVYTGTYIEEPTLPMATYHPGQAGLHKPSSDYGDGDFEELEMAEELLDTAAPTVGGKGDETSRMEGGQEDYDHGAVDMGEANMDMELDGHPNPEPVISEEERIQIEHQRALAEQLAQEKADLAAQLADARAAELSKAGEVSIVRNNLQKATREHERIISSLKSHQAEEIARLKAEIADLQAKETRMETELTFIRKDLEETNRRNAMLERKPKEPGAIGGSTSKRNDSNNGFPELTFLDADRSKIRTPPPGSMAVTGRKFAFRDGFEDEEMVLPVDMGSPSGRKKGVRTPTRMGSKRKRSYHESPVSMQLPLSAPRSARIEDAKRAQRPEGVDGRVLDFMWEKARDEWTEFFEAAMLHVDPVTGERVFDIMSRYSFPSDVNTTMSAFFFSRVTTLPTKASSSFTSANGAGSEFLLSIFEVLFEMWRRCIIEVFYGALSPILELIRFTLLWNLGESSYSVMDKAVGLATETLQAYVLPRHPAKNLKAMSQKQGLGHQIIPDLVLDHCHACMAILEGIALDAVGEEHTLRRFWRLTPADFPILLLSISQPITLSLPMATILITSVTPTSFGPCTTDLNIQRENELYLIDHITKLLVDAPRAPGIQYNREHLLKLRIAILGFLGACVGGEVGKQAMTKSQYLLPRLVKRVGEEIDELYEWRCLLRPTTSFESPKSTSSTTISTSPICKPPSDNEARHRINLINSAVRIMYAVIMAAKGVAQERLAPTVTFQRHLVAMARVAMSSGEAQEEGIAEDVVEKAAAVLGELLRPDEAEEIEGLFDVGWGV